MINLTENDINQYRDKNLKNQLKLGCCAEFLLQGEQKWQV